MRPLIIAGNWKMHTRLAEAMDLAKAVRGGLDGSLSGKAQVILCPPFISLAAVAEAVKGSPVQVGAQNAHFQPQGAFTGEVSVPMLADLCRYVIIGHSERRQYFHEDDALLNKKLQAVAAVKLTPIFCVGETLEENKAGKTVEVLTRQVKEGLKGLTFPKDGLIVAYEPVWAIGTGLAARGPDANQSMGLIRELLAGLYGNDFAQATPILYGGSVKSDNIAEFAGQPEIDGGLVGGASLKAEEFLSIVKNAVAARKG